MSTLRKVSNIKCILNTAAYLSPVVIDPSHALNLNSTVAAHSSIAQEHERQTHIYTELEQVLDTLSESCTASCGTAIHLIYYIADDST
jgi:hypothetical protein